MPNSSVYDRRPHRLAGLAFRILYSFERYRIPRKLWLHIKALESYNVKVYLSGGHLPPLTMRQVVGFQSTPSSSFPSSSTHIIGGNLIRRQTLPRSNLE
jgi:hypothetical protein